jgi:hypothetical protein
MNIHREIENQSVVASVLVEREYYPGRESYQFREPKKWAWVARLAWKLLKRLGALDMLTERLVRFDFGKKQAEFCGNEILKKCENLHEFHDDPSRYICIVGNEQFREILHSPDFHREAAFIAGPLARGGRFRSAEYFGVRIYCIPHLSGWAMIPRHIVEVEVRP